MSKSWTTLFQGIVGIGACLLPMFASAQHDHAGGRSYQIQSSVGNRQLSIPQTSAGRQFTDQQVNESRQRFANQNYGYVGQTSNNWNNYSNRDWNYPSRNYQARHWDDDDHDHHYWRRYHDRDRYYYYNNYYYDPYYAPYPYYQPYSYYDNYYYDPYYNPYYDNDVGIGAGIYFNLGG
jgi:hypothetical protein